MPLTEPQIQRYARHIVLPEVGGIGQERLLGSSVLIVGAGGLGSPAALYLAAAGIGRIGIVDDDRVDLSNLQRQILHGHGGVGRLKAESAAESLARLDPAILVEPHPLRLTAQTVDKLVGGYDLVLDGSDNFATRYLVADACHGAAKPLVSAAMFQFSGQLAVFPPGGPCYRCLYPAPPAREPPNCATAGVLGALAGVMGSLQSVEAVKLLLGIGEPATGRLLLYEALSMSFEEIRFARRPDCVLCGHG